MARSLLLLAGCLCLPAGVAASPWTLPKGTLVVKGRFDHDTADEQYLDSTDARPFSLNGKYQASTFTLGVRYGLTDRLEITFALPVRQVAYESDPVILARAPAGVDPYDHAQANVIDFSRNAMGVADVTFGGRYRLWRGVTVGAAQVMFKAPTGYEPPSGTFARAPKSVAEFQARAAEFVAPDNVLDDVTLGDGQMDITASLLTGWALASGTFFRLDAGYRLRLGGAGDEVVGSTRVGQTLGDRVLVFAGVDGCYAVQTGKVIGVSVFAEDPNLPAEDFAPGENLGLRQVTLDRDRLALPFGAIVRVTPTSELSVGYSAQVWGRNTSRIHTASVGFAMRTSGLDGG